MRVNLTLDPEQGEELRKRAQAQGLSLGTFLRWIAYQWLERKRREEVAKAAREAKP